MHGFAERGSLIARIGLTRREKVLALVLLLASLLVTLLVLAVTPSPAAAAIHRVASRGHDPHPGWPVSRRFDGLTAAGRARG
jgi:hypothetical protein